MIVADIDKKIGIQLFLFNLGINIRREPNNVPKPAKNDNINDICIFILKYIKKESKNDNYISFFTFKV